MTEGVKADGDKPRFSLLPMREVWQVVAVLERGARKYSTGNWKFVRNAPTRYFDAAMRHISARREGEKLDQETNLPHLAHAVCCLLFWMWHDNKRGR